MEISYAIQHHPSRADLLYRSAELSPEIVTDPFPDSVNKNPWRTYRTALERTPLEASHRVIIQDDAELCTDFDWALRGAIRARPDDILCLFVPTTLIQGARKVRAACDADETFTPLLHQEWCPVVALCWPTTVIPTFLAWADRVGYSLNKMRADDAIVGQFARETRTFIYATVPSLVEHPDDVESTINTRTMQPRRAVCFAGEKAHLIKWREA
jgi:hypothetical protein